MRKKILSILLALCMVLALLPVAAFAAKLTDAQVAELKAKGYTDEQIQELNDQIADYESDEIVLVFEDTTISAAESRLVLVVAPKATVTVDGAKLDTGIVVAPGAADAKVVLKAGADVNAVVVLDKAEVVVEQEAKAANVTLAAAEAAATVEGTVDTVAVNEAAEKATVTVAEGAAVAAVEVAAPEAKADIAGSVSTVVVAETAKGAETAVAQTAQVSAVTVAAPEAKTDIAGTVSSVTVAETAEGAGTTVSGTVDSVAVDAPNTKTDVADTGSVGSVTVGENATGTEVNAADGASVGEVVDPAGNNSGNTAAEPEPSPSPSAKPSPAPVDPEPDEPVTPPSSNAQIIAAPIGNETIGHKPYDTYSVSASGSNVTVTVTGLQKHLSSDTEQAKLGEKYWVGIAIPVPAEDQPYKYVVIETNKTTGAATAVILASKPVVAGTQLKDQNIANAVDDEFYQCIYFDESDYTNNTIEVIAVDSDAEANAIKSAVQELKTATETAATKASEAETAANNVTTAQNELDTAKAALTEEIKSKNTAATKLEELLKVGEPTEDQTAEIAELKTALGIATDAAEEAITTAINAAKEAYTEKQSAITEKETALETAQGNKTTADEAKDVADAVVTEANTDLTEAKAEGDLDLNVTVNANRADSGSGPAANSDPAPQSGASIEN